MHNCFLSLPKHKQVDHEIVYNHKPSINLVESYEQTMNSNSHQKTSSMLALKSSLLFASMVIKFPNKICNLLKGVNVD